MEVFAEVLDELLALDDELDEQELPFEAMLLRVDDEVVELDIVVTIEVNDEDEL